MRFSSFSTALLVLLISTFSYGKSDAQSSATEQGDSTPQVFVGIPVAAPIAIAAPTSIAEYSPDIVELIGNPSVQKDLELVDDQVQRIMAMQIEWSQEVQDSMTGLRNGTISGEEYTRKLVAGKMLRKQLVDSLLLPHQTKRLDQIANQTRIERSGTATAISSKAIAAKLKLTDDQKLELQERSKMLEKKLAEEIAKLKREAKESLLEVLTKEQRRTLDDLTGDQFRMQADDWKQAMELHSKMNR